MAAHPTPAADTPNTPLASGAERVVAVPHCPVCGGHHPETMFEEPPFKVQRCPDCSMVWVTPRIHEDEIHKVYSESYWNSASPKERGYADYHRDEPLYLKTFQRRAKLVDRFVPAPARVLDVGCAAGFFLRVMRERGHDVWGLELSQPIAARARAALGDERVHIGTLDDLPHTPASAVQGGRPAGFTPGSFDLVTLWDVIEHVPDYRDLLRSVRRMLKPGGTLLLETQNVSSRFAKLMGPRWQHYKHEEHLYHFNPSTIGRVLDEEGFEVVRNHPAFGGKYVSFRFIAERAGRLPPPFSWLFKPLGLLGSTNLYVNLRDEMVVVAKLKG